jgi:hypothetical protein
MAAIDKVFGLILVLAGLTIAIYWTIWQFLSLPILKKSHPIHNFFLDPYYLFKVPCFALIVGLLLIDQFISGTNRKIAAEKARKEAEDAKKKKN